MWSYGSFFCELGCQGFDSGYGMVTGLRSSFFGQGRVLWIWGWLREFLGFFEARSEPRVFVFGGRYRGSVEC